MKAINSSRDLAVNGALPAFDTPLHVGKPNIGAREEFIRYVNDIFDRGWLTNNGSLVQEFERRIAEYIGVKHCIAMCNGTKALEIAIRALGLESEVIIGAGSVILPGVTIGEGVAVGALSLVKGELVPFGIYAGSPLKRLSDRSQRLLELGKQYLRNTGGFD